MTWTYKQSTGQLTDSTGFLVATGYAGMGKGMNNPEMQGVQKIGPLPVGKYTFGTPVPYSHLGPFAIPLIPDSSNEMFGRGDFYVHGDSVDDPGNASEGCIIQSHPIRDLMWTSGDHQLEVVA